MPTGMPYFVTQTATLRRLNEAVNDLRTTGLPCTRASILEALTNLGPLTMSDEDIDKLIKVGSDNGVFDPPNDDDDRHVKLDWFKNAALFWSVTPVAGWPVLTEIIRAGFVAAIKIANADHPARPHGPVLPIEFLWICHYNTTKPSVGICWNEKTPIQVTVIIDTANPLDPRTLAPNPPLIPVSRPDIGKAPRNEPIFVVPDDDGIIDGERLKS